mgnify:CR=1 FL=1
MSSCHFLGARDVISTTGEYALRAAVFLAQHHPDPQTTALIAEGTKVPSGYLSKILQAMVRAELVHSQRGLHGGFTLVRDPEVISVLDVLSSVSAAPRRIEKCPLGIEGHRELCPVHSLVDQSVAQARDAFAGANLELLTESTQGSKPLCET